MNSSILFHTVRRFGSVHLSGQFHAATNSPLRKPCIHHLHTNSHTVHTRIRFQPYQHYRQVCTSQTPLQHKTKLSSVILFLTKPQCVMFKSLSNTKPVCCAPVTLQSVSKTMIRFMSRINQRDSNTVYYVVAAAVAMVGLSFAAVPLYKIFCQTTGFGGTTQISDSDKIKSMETIKDRQITVRFTADVASSMRWNFKPQQREVVVYPGETALAFYTACNPTDVPIIGISTYNITPYDAGIYFNKIQCFCFEEQRLNPHEQVDMPVFFYIDPEFDEDPKMQYVHTVTLSYTFFEAKEGFELPIPDYLRPHARTQ